MIVHFSEVERNNIVELSQQTLWNEDSDDVKEALHYYKEVRGLSESTIKSFRFGYYPARLKRAGHDWAGRLIMPLYDQHDNLIVLTSRDFRNNSHLHEEFDKRYYLFGINIAKPNIIKWQKAIVVEGQFDTSYSHSKGIGITVGLLGSAFSMHHVSVLARYCNEIFLSFDNDYSGYGNLARSIYMYKLYGLESFGITFIPVLLPKHKDPDEFLHKESNQDYMNILNESKKKTIEFGTIQFYKKLLKLNPQIETKISKEI